MRKRPWKTSEIKRFTDIYPTTEMSELKEIFDRSESALYAMATKLRLEKQIKSNAHIRAKTETRKYTTEEDRLIRQMLIDGKTADEIADAVNRSKSAIMHRRIHLGLSKPNFWSAEDESFLERSFHIYRTEFLAKLLNRTPLAIEAKALRMGLIAYE